MKLLILLICICKLQATIALVQHPLGHTTGCSGTTCAATVTSTGSGHLGVFMMLPLNSIAGSTLTSIADNAGSTYVVPGTCHAGVSVNPYPMWCGYTLSTVSGATTVTATYSVAPSDMYWTYIEYSGNTPFTFDVLGTVDARASCTSCAGVTLTLNGTRDVIVQGSQSNVTGATAISAPYTSPDDHGSGFAGSINTSSGTAPTWTMSGTTTDLELIGIAFTEASGKPPGQFPRVN